MLEQLLANRLAKGREWLVSSNWQPQRDGSLDCPVLALKYSFYHPPCSTSRPSTEGKQAFLSFCGPGAHCLRGGPLNTSVRYTALTEFGAAAVMPRDFHIPIYSIIGGITPVLEMEHSHLK